jgi:chemotaxis protein histidine kinase CheA
MATQGNQTTGLAIHLSQTDLQSAGAVYTQAAAYLNKYRATQEALISLAEKSGVKLCKEMDDKLMAWQVSAKKAVSSIEAQRKPFTEKAHAFIKAFTAIENELGKDLYDPIQKLRDTSARIHAEEAAEAARKEREELAAKQKRIDNIANLETQLRNGYAALLGETKRTILQVYSNFDLENAEEARVAIQSFVNANLSTEAWETITLVGSEELIAEVRTAERFANSSTHFTSEVTKYAEYILEMFPARVAELEQGIANNKAAEELRQKQEQEAKEAKEAAEKRAADEAAKAKQQANVTVMVAQANRQEEAPKTVESYSVSVGSVDGWRAIVDYYLTNSGTSVEDLAKVKLDQMRMFAEKQAKATGEMVEHKDVVYEPKYKAVARVSKKRAA